MEWEPKTDLSQDRILYGTDEPPPLPLRLSAGALSIEIIGGGIRALRWRGVEAVRGVDFLVRDENWGTLSAQDIEEDSGSSSDSFFWRRRFRLADGALDCLFSVRGAASGHLTAECEITARREIWSNRAGLTVLHPIKGVAGEPINVQHTNDAEEARFPTHISPSQPVFDIVGLRHTVGPVEVDIAFDGEIFEMEDQRNWTDASFKTYCRPLTRPAPFVIAEGETIKQSVTIDFKNRPGVPNAAPGTSVDFALTSTDEAIPEIMLAVEPGWLVDTGVAEATALACVRRLLVRMRSKDADDLFARLKTAAPDAKIDLEAVISDDRPSAVADMSTMAAAASRHSIAVEHVIALPAAFLKSYQPDGQWPVGLTPAEAVELTRAAFPTARIGGGCLTNFTEFNRHRPNTSACDYVTHGTTAIVHAADDRSVIETLEALPHVFATAREIADSTAYRLGLVSIGMRSNPYGAKLADNPYGGRVPMASIDPRQNGLFAAAWAIGSVAATQNTGIEALAVAAPGGPFATWESRALRPIHHAVRALARAHGAPRLRVTGLPAPLAGVAYKRNGLTWLIIANLGPDPIKWSPPYSSRIRSLDMMTAADATHVPDWLDEPTQPAPEELWLSAFGIAALNWRTTN